MALGLRSSCITEQLGGPNPVVFGFRFWERLRWVLQDSWRYAAGEGEKMDRQQGLESQALEVLALERDTWLKRETRADHSGKASNGKAAGTLWILGIKCGGLHLNSQHLRGWDRRLAVNSRPAWATYCVTGRLFKKPGHHRASEMAQQMKRLAANTADVLS